MYKTKILIADVHLLVREGIKFILIHRKDIEIIGEVTSNEQLLNSIVVDKPDVIIIDFCVPNHFNSNDIALLIKKYPSISILILSCNENREDITKVIDFGVKAYVSKSGAINEVIKAIDASIIKNFFLSERVSKIIRDEVVCTNDSIIKNNSIETCLSEREIEIINHIAEGITTKNIAKRLFLSFHTVNTHRKNIFKKLKVHSSSELVTCAIQKGLINNQTI